MALSAGHRLGPYEIVAPLGAGGMGEVYRALDTRLRREVAVKVLPSEVASDPDRLRRFEQEARAAAALHHPGVLAVYDVGTEDETSFLVTELLQGETLRDTLGRGPLPLDRTLHLARQILEALATAHDHGIVHRDLKPENLFLTRHGQAKILDFGLAKLVDAPGADFANAVTVAGGTQTGTVVGTAGYMAPEQVLGAEVDRRADLFAMGTLLFEALTGRRAFHRASAIDTLHAILHDEPQAGVSGTSALTPALEAVLRRALAKSPAERFQSARDFLFAFELAATVPTIGGSVHGSTDRQRRVPWLLLIAGSVVALGLALFAAKVMRVAPSGATHAPAARFTTGALTPLTIDPGFEGEPAFLPDGETIAYVSDRSGDFEIYLQQVSGGSAINLTRDPGDDAQPAVSPDGRSIAFVSTRSSVTSLIYATPRLAMSGGDIWVMPTLGGLARKVAEDGNSPTWSPDGSTLYFVRGLWYRSELRRVAATGGESTKIPLELPGAPSQFFRVRASPDGRHLALLAGEMILTVPVEGGRASFVTTGRDPFWEPDGRGLVYCSSVPGRNWSLWRQPLDGAALPLGSAESLLVGPATLATPALSVSGRRLAVVAVDRTSNFEELPFDAETGRVLGAPRALTSGRNEITFASASPDGHSLAFESMRGASSHIWRFDAGGEPVQLIGDRRYSESFPRWAPDGSRIAFIRRLAGEPRRPDNAQLWLMSPDGGDPRLLVDEGGNAAWLPDSRGLIFVRSDSFRRVEIATGRVEPLRLDGPKATAIFVVSPDGAWLVYGNSEAGHGDLELAPIAGGTTRPIVRSPRLDAHPSFSPSGRWLYYQVDHRNLFRIPGPAQGWRAAEPEQVTRFVEPGLFLEEPFVASDGERLLYSRVRTVGDVWIVDAAEPPAASDSKR